MEAQRYAVTPAMKASSPMWAISCRRVEAPLAYEMPSKSCSAAWASRAADPATGCVDGVRSAAYPQALRATLKSTHASSNSVASTQVRWAMYSAKDSLSHRSSHHCMVTRSPNHMWAIS